jgi:hypothetical protein
VERVSEPASTALTATHVEAGPTVRLRAGPDDEAGVPGEAIKRRRLRRGDWIASCMHARHRLPDAQRREAGAGRERAMEILIVLILLLVLFGGGGFYTGRSGYAGPGAGLGNILYILAVIVLIVIVLRLLGLLGIWV